MIPNRRRLVLIATAAAITVASAGTAIAFTSTRSKATTVSDVNPKKAAIERHIREFGPAGLAWAQAHPALARKRLLAALRKLHAEAKAYRANYRAPRARIVATKDSPFPQYQFQAQNAYDGSLDGHTIRVVAGCAEKGTPAVYHCQRGAVGIWAEQTGVPGGLVEIGIFRAPTKASLTITAFHGVKLTLRSSAGQIFTFNLRTHQFT